jgi:hypothetical protein
MCSNLIDLLEYYSSIDEDNFSKEPDMPGFCYKRIFIVALLLLSLPLTQAVAALITYDDSWSAQGLTLTEQRDDGLELLFSLDSWQLEQSVIDGRLQHTVGLPQAFLPNDAGKPDLPGQGFFVALPNGATARLEITEVRTETLTDIDLAPAFRLPLETEDGPLDFTRDEAVYSADLFYPANPVILGEPHTIRGVEALMLGITPFQYNPVTRELVIYRDLRISISFEGGDGHFGEDRLRSRWWDPILRSTFINSDLLAEVDYDAGAGVRTPDYEYLIIAPDQAEFLVWADSIRVFRNEQGIRSGVVTITEVGGNTTTAIENYINDAYLNWDHAPSAVMLLGDYSTGTDGITSPLYYYDYTCVSDNIYADVDGDDLPEMAFARLCGRDGAEMGHLVSKALEYERNPPQNPDFYQNPVIAGGWQTERWFILCDEVIFGFMTNELNKTPVREYAIYSGTPETSWSSATNTGVVVSYFGPSGLGYLPATPEHLNDWGGNATRLNADINSGSFIVQHRDHGGVTGWGEPGYSISNLSGLSNEDLTFVFSINCLTGKYNSTTECFTEAFHRHAQGALGLIAASETSYSFVNDTYVWGMFDYFWPDFDPGYGVSGGHQLLPSFANAYGKLYLQASSWPYNTTNKQDTYHLFHHHGDAFTSVYSEMPRHMTVSHGEVLLTGLEVFTVTADQGALIGISRDGEYLGSGIATGFPTDIEIPSQFPGGNVTITVTLQNHFRYRQEIPVVPPSGAYLIFAETTVLDTEGNGNGAMDEDEMVGLNLQLKNVGIEVSTGITVTITSDDLYIDILEGTRSFPDIPADGFGTCSEPFTAHVSSTVPDGHLVQFDYEAVANEGTWSGHFELPALAPVLVAGGMTINDTPPQGGNGSGTADAGETFLIDLELGNIGHSDCSTLNGYLSCNAMGVSILGDFSSSGPIPMGGSVMFPGYQIAIDPSFPEPSLVTLELMVTGYDGYSKTVHYDLAVGGWFDDCEQDNGWTVVTTASSGSWERLDPIGTDYNGLPIQPEDDHSPAPGTVCFVTGNGSVGGSAGENDVDSGLTTLYSPVFNMTGAGEATFSYWRWYTNDQGNDPGTDWWRVQVTNNGENWVDLEATQASDASWQQFTFELSDYVTMSDQVQIRFVAADEGDGSLVEAAVDDILLDVSFPILTAVDDEAVLPARLGLVGNYPNPFNPQTSILFDLPHQADVELAIYDVTGRRVVTLVQGKVAAGRHEAVWYGRDSGGHPVASGLYFSRLVSEGEVLTRKMMLLK